MLCVFVGFCFVVGFVWFGFVVGGFVWFCFVVGFLFGFVSLIVFKQTNI